MAKCVPDAAIAYLSAGLCALPAIRAEKRPAVGRWKQYQTTLPTRAEMSAWISNNPDAVCIVCGQASGNLEAIDFDAGGELYPAWQNRIPADIRDKLVIETTPSGGLHVIYRCECAISGNLKLAQRKNSNKTETLIETRGEGGLILCAPTEGYKVIQGDICKPPLLSEAERETLLQAAWDMNELSAENSNNAPLSEPHSHNGSYATDNSNNGNRPGDDFNNRGDVRSLLEQAGWSRAFGGDNEYWRRPGKDSGWSASLKDSVFYVFSSNAAPFDPNQAYSPFSVYTLLACGGDFNQAARQLRQLGYGSDYATDDPTGPNISAIVEKGIDSPADISDIYQCATDNSHNAPDDKEITDPGPTPDSLLYVPGFIGSVIDFCMSGAPYPNLGMAFCGALAMQSHLCGRKVREMGDLRTNLYILALASSSAGKNYPRQINSHLAISTLNAFSAAWHLDRILLLVNHSHMNPFSESGPNARPGQFVHDTDQLIASHIKGISCDINQLLSAYFLKVESSFIGSGQPLSIHRRKGSRCQRTMLPIRIGLGIRPLSTRR